MNIKLQDNVLLIKGKDNLVTEIFADGGMAFSTNKYPSLDEQEEHYDVCVGLNGELMINGWNIRNLISYAVKAERKQVS